MSAQIPETMPLSDLLKSTGYDCPEELQDKTFAEATSGGDVEVETNKAATIDVSQYTEPVAITPSEGKDAMAKATVTLSNIPSSGSATLYCWANLHEGKTSYVYHNFSAAPENTDNWKMLALASIGDESNIGELALDDWEGWYGSDYTYTKDSDTQFTISDDSGDYVYTRVATKDVTLWG